MQTNDGGGQWIQSDNNGHLSGSGDVEIPINWNYA